MSFRGLSISIFSGVLMGVGSAQAADVFVPVSDQSFAVASVARWTGLFVGAGIGGTFSSAHVYSEVYDYDWNDQFFFHNLSSDMGKFGFLGTVEAGYDHQFGNMVAGVAANYDFAGRTRLFADSYWDDTDGTCIEDDFGCSYTYKSHELTFGNSWAVTARLGVLVQPTTLLYGLAGYTQANISAVGESDIDDDYFTTISESGWRPGFVVGAGAETMLTENVSLKGEYRYARYHGFDGFTGPGGGDYYQLMEVSNPTVHSVRAVLTYRFGGHKQQGAISAGY